MFNNIFREYPRADSVSCIKSCTVISSSSSTSANLSRSCCFSSVPFFRSYKPYVYLSLTESFQDRFVCAGRCSQGASPVHPSATCKFSAIPSSSSCSSPEESFQRSVGRVFCSDTAQAASHEGNSYKPRMSACKKDLSVCMHGATRVVSVLIRICITSSLAYIVHRMVYV